MAKAKLFFPNIWYFIRCWFARNPNNPKAPRLWDLKPGTKFKTLFYGREEDVCVIVRVFWVISEHDGELDFIAEVQGYKGRLGEIYLADKGVVPYLKVGWHKNRVPYFVD